MSSLKFFTLWLLLILCIVIVAFNSCDKDDDKSNSPTSDQDVVINGVKWATRNVAAPGRFTAKIEDFGMFYQWNREKAWPATGNVTDWDASSLTSTQWEIVNDPSPFGWRVPTSDEIETLFDSDKVSNVWTTKNGVSGRKFTDKTSGNSIFFPAAGYRFGSDGMLIGVGSYGGYWSGMQYENYGFPYYFYFDSEKADWLYGSNNMRWPYDRRGGFSIRAVENSLLKKLESQL